MQRRGRTIVALLLAAAAVGCSSADDGGEAAVGEDVAAERPVAVAPVPSAGCAGDVPAVAAGEAKVTLRSGDEERWYLRQVPPAHDGATPVPVVVDLHGYTEGADVHAVHSGLGPFGAEAGFVTITPQGTGPVALWRAVPGSPDVAFTADLLDDVGATLCVDTARVFVTGLSNGAMMASVLACELADRIAAVAPVAGVTQVDGCAPGRPVPVVAFHGTEDPFLDYDGGFGTAVAGLPAPSGEGTLGDVQPAVVTPVPDVLAAWAGRNGCAGAAPTEEAVAEDVTLLAFDCPAGAEVEFYRVDGGGHTWPGAEMLRTATDVVGVTTFSITANDVMWNFFTQVTGL